MASAASIAATTVAPVAATTVAPVKAATVAPITVDTYERATRTITGTQAIDIKASGSIDGTSTPALKLSSTGAVTNAGLLRGNKPGVQAISVTLKGANITNASTGRMLALAGNVIEIAAGTPMSTITNSGAISAATTSGAILSFSPLTLTNTSTGQINTLSGTALQIASGVTASQIDNSGAIKATVTGTAVRLGTATKVNNKVGGEISSAKSYGIYVDKDGAGSTINNDGRISGGGKDAGIFTNAALTVTNNGTGLISSLVGDAIHFAQAATVGSASTFSIVNNGKIQSYIGGTAIYAEGPLKVVNQALGLISSVSGNAISASGTKASTISNAGLITTTSGAGIVASAPMTITNSVGGVISSTSGKAVEFNSTDAKTVASLDNKGTIQGGRTDGSGSAIVNSGKGALSLTNAGTIIGKILFGDKSADRLTVAGGTITGAIRGAGDNDIVAYNLAATNSTFTAGGISNLANLNLDKGIVSFTAPISAVKAFSIAKNARAVLQSSLEVATLSNSGVLQLASNYDLTGNYKQLDGGKLQIDIGATTAGRLSVSGSATFADKSSIYANAVNPLQLGQSYVILSAGSAPALATSAQSMVITSNSNNPFLKLRVVPTGTSLSLQVTKTSTSMATAALTASAGLSTTPVALKSLAGLVGNLNASASPSEAAEFHSLSTALAGLQGGALITAAGQSQANPTVLGGVAAGSLNAGNSNIDTIGDRLARARANYYPATASAYRAMVGLAADARVDVWGQALQGSNQPSADGYGGYRPGTAGLIMGSDAQLTRDVRVGAALGLSQTVVDGRDSALPGNARLQSYQGTLYANRDFGNAYLEGQLGYAYNDTRTMRVIEFAQRIANASFGGNQTTMRVASGYRFNVEGWHLTPNAHVQYARLSNNRYGETDAGALNLTVAGNRVEQAQGALGLRAAYPVTTTTGFFTPELRFSLLRNLNPRALQTNAWFADGSPAFSSSGAQADRNGVNLGLNVSFVAQHGLKLLISGDYLRSGDARVYSTTFKLSNSF